MKPIGYYNEAHGFLHDEFDKDCYCQGGCSMEAVYTESQVKKLTGENKTEKLQEQLNNAKKALTEIIFLVKDVMTLNILLLLHKKHSQRLEGMMTDKDIEDIKKAFEPVLIVILKLPFWLERHFKWYTVDSKYNKYRIEGSGDE